MSALGGRPSSMCLYGVSYSIRTCTPAGKQKPPMVAAACAAGVWSAAAGLASRALGTSPGPALHGVQ